jgi:hypothetical protein
VLDLCQLRFEGRRLRPDELVICADEKSQLQALGRRHETVPPGPGRPALVEFEYRRRGTLAYLAAWDVHHANLFDRVEAKTGIEPFGRLVEQVVTREPYASARTVYWIVDNGSSHAAARLDRAARGHLAEPAARPPPDPRLLAQPDRALLLDRPAQGAQPQQLRLARRARRSVAALRRALPPDRPTVRLDLRRRRPGARARQDHRARATACACGVTDRNRAALSRLKGAARGR